jgi:hypothetical protein
VRGRPRIRGGRDAERTDPDRDLSELFEHDER